MDSLTFVGTATTLLRLGPFTLLTDPNFLHQGQRAYLGKGLWSRRLTEPALQPDDLPDLDAVLLSHLHGDHFDRVARRRLPRTPPVVTTPPAARRLERWGFSAHAMEHWDEHVMQRDGAELKIQSLPARHARGVVGALLPPVMGSLLELREGDGPPLRVYISGDTVTGPHLEDIARRHPDIDVAVLHLGGTRVLWHKASMDAADGLHALRLLRPGACVPVHHDDYRVFRSPLSDFTGATTDAGLERLVHVVERGETVPLSRFEVPEGRAGHVGDKVIHEEGRR
jgi:L-ascorbate metabolism protein UlaG (beta-lactamase superfamily)